MEVKIIIRRKAPQEVHERLKPVLMELRSLAMQQDGYISGETLMNMDDPQELLVISTWRSLDCWDRWIATEKRQELQRVVDEILGDHSYYQVYCYA